MPDHEELIDRRATISRYDGRFNISLGAIGTVIAIVVGLTSLTGAAYAAARLGVAAAVRSEINAQVESDRSPISRRIEEIIHEHEMEVCEPRWNEIRSRLRLIENEQAAISAKLDILLEHSRNERNGG